MPISETVRSGWTTPRGEISADDTLVSASATTMKFANIPDYCYRPPSTQNAIEIAFLMGVNAEACAAYVFAARKNGDIVRVWAGTITAGTMEATDKGDHGHFVDTFAASTDSWITTIKEVDAGGGNRMSRLVFDTCGYSYFFVQYTGLSNEDVTAMFSGW